MPYRAIGLLAGIIGVLLLVVLAAVGVNVYRASRRGPGWKRSLITAGLVMLGMMSTTSCTTSCYVVDIGGLQADNRQGLQNVSDRLDILEEQVAGDELEPWVVEHVLDSLEQELKDTANREDLQLFTESEARDLVRKKNALQTRIDTLRKRVGEE